MLSGPFIARVALFLRQLLVLEDSHKPMCGTVMGFARLVEIGKGRRQQCFRMSREQAVLVRLLGC